MLQLNSSRFIKGILLTVSILSILVLTLSLAGIISFHQGIEAINGQCPYSTSLRIGSWVVFEHHKPGLTFCSY